MSSILKKKNVKNALRKFLKCFLSGTLFFINDQEVANWKITKVGAKGATCQGGKRGKLLGCANKLHRGGGH